MTNPTASPSTVLHDENDALEKLRAYGGRLTRTRRELVRYFYAQNDALTAEDLIAAFPLIDPATIYRTLATLEHAGIVTHSHLGHGPATYQRAGSASVPCVCQHCGTVRSVPNGELAELAGRLETSYGFVLDLHHFALTGTCTRCRPKPRKVPARA